MAAAALPAALDRLITAGRGGLVFSCHLEHLTRACREPAYRRLLSLADLRLASGRGVFWAARLLRSPLVARIRPLDLLDGTCAYASRAQRRVFVVGENMALLDGVLAHLRRRFASLRIAGSCWFPPAAQFDPSFSALTVETIRAARPDLLLVGLAPPRRERWLHAQRAALAPAVAVGLDFPTHYGDTRATVAGWLRRPLLEVSRWLPPVALRRRPQPPHRG